uniref:THO complex subunit 7 homolog n=1 Tax=Ascaris lumbricoides TaxID=6252 RepID=A0A9J2PT14_ASCLU
MSKCLGIMNEECIIRKLVADGDGAGDDRRFATLASLIMKLIKDPENARSYLPRITQLLDAAKTSMHKQALIATTNEYQINKYEQMAHQIDSEIVRAHERMQLAKKELEAAKAVRRNKEEYEALANVIQQYPSRQETNMKLEAVKKQLEEQHERQRKLEAKLMERKNHLHAFSMILANVSGFLKEEEEECATTNEDENGNNEDVEIKDES